MMMEVWKVALRVECSVLMSVVLRVVLTVEKMVFYLVALWVS